MGHPLQQVSVSNAFKRIQTETEIYRLFLVGVCVVSRSRR